VTTKPENLEDDEEDTMVVQSKSKHKSKQEAKQGFKKPSEEVKEHKAFKGFFLSCLMIILAELDEKDVQLWFEKTFPTKWANVL